MIIHPAINLIFQYIWQDIILLFTITALILLVLAEMLFPKYGNITMKIDISKLIKIAFTTGILAIISQILGILLLGLKQIQNRKN